MAIASSAIKDDFDLTFKGVASARVYSLMSEADKLLVRHLGYRKKTINVALTADERVFDIDDEAVWIVRARYMDAPHATPGQLGGYLLDETSVDEEDTSGEDWTANSSGAPERFMQTHDLAGGQIGFERPVSDATLLVSGATNATPIVVTSNAAHGLADGDRVDILDVLGNTAANGEWYADVLSATTFALYSDSDLATPVAGSGAYTSGGIVHCAGSPFVQMEVHWHEAQTSSTSLPDTPILRDLFVEHMCWGYAKRRRMQEAPGFKAAFEEMFNEQLLITRGRGGRKPPRVRVFKQRPGGYAARTRW